MAYKVPKATLPSDLNKLPNINEKDYESHEFDQKIDHFNE
jgi:hypothetical protein